MDDSLIIPYSDHKVSVVIIDDQIGVSELAHRFINGLGSFNVLCEAGTSAQGLETCRKYRPEIVITALALSETNGSLLIPLLRGEDPKLRVIVYTGTRNQALLLAALEERPDGFVHKTEPIEILRDVLLSVAKGKQELSPFARNLLRERKTRGNLSSLTTKDRQILQLLAEGKSSREMSDLLKLTPRTLDNYRAALKNKLAAPDLPTLTRHAIRLGLIDV